MGVITPNNEEHVGSHGDNGSIFCFSPPKASGKTPARMLGTCIDGQHVLIVLTVNVFNLHPRNLTQIPKIAIFKGSYLFQTIILGIQPLVFGSVT